MVEHDHQFPELHLLLLSGQAYHRSVTPPAQLEAVLSHAHHRRQAGEGFTRNRTHATITNTPFPLPETHPKAAGTNVRDLHAGETRGGKSDPWVRFLVM